MFLMQVYFINKFFNKMFLTLKLFLGIDTDKYKYPIGSGRITFSTYQSYTKAVAASFVEVKTPKFCKKVFIKLL